MEEFWFGYELTLVYERNSKNDSFQGSYQSSYNQVEALEVYSFHWKEENQSVYCCLQTLILSFGTNKVTVFQGNCYW